MDIQSLLCPLSSQAHFVNPPTVITAADFYSKTDDINTHHERQPSCTSFPDSPTSPTSSSSSFYSIPSSPEIEALPSVMSPISVSGGQSQTQSQNRLNRSNNISSGGGHSHTRTPWSAEEDELLQQGYSQDMSWAMISTIYLPHRSRGCCWGRFKTLQAKALEQREWSDSEDRLLQIAIKKNSRLFKQAWKAVSQDMNNRSWRECELRSTKITSTTIRKKQQTRNP